MAPYANIGEANQPVCISIELDDECFAFVERLEAVTRAPRHEIFQMALHAPVRDMETKAVGSALVEGCSNEAILILEELADALEGNSRSRTH